MNKNNYKEITIYELNLLYLESKYNQISPSTYGSYQDRAKIINEYMGNLKVRNIDNNIIKNFYNYMKNKKTWNYTDKISDTTINNIMSYLYTLINKAVFWKIISKDSINNPKNISKDNIKSRLFVKERKDLLFDLEYKRVSNKINNLLNI